MNRTKKDSAIRQYLHCVELSTGNANTGVLELSKEDMRATFYVYDSKNSSLGDEVAFDYVHPIFLKTCKNEIYSLYGCFGGKAGSQGFGSGNRVESFSIYPDFALVGYSKWLENDLVKRHKFRSLGMATLFSGNETEIEARNMDKCAELIDEAMHVSCDGLSIKYKYDLAWDMVGKTPKTVDPYFELEFDQRISIEKSLSLCSYLLTLFSACLWKTMRPKYNEVNRLSRKEWLAAIEIEPNDVDDGHGIRFYRELEVDKNDIGHISGSPIIAWPRQEFFAMEETVKSWIERRKEWQKACSLMISCIGMNHEISENRVLAVSKWFENIPNAKSMGGMCSKHVEQIADAASKVAKKLGYTGDISKRVAGSVRRLKEETHRERIERLVIGVNKFYKQELLSKKAVQLIVDANTIRGKAAHGTLSESDGMKRISNSIVTKETLCFLLTFQDLPLSDESKRRIRRHPIVEESLYIQKELA